MWNETDLNATSLGACLDFCPACLFETACDACVEIVKMQ